MLVRKGKTVTHIHNFDFYIKTFFPVDHCPISPKAIIPAFHYSTIPIVERSGTNLIRCRDAGKRDPTIGEFF